MIIDASAILAIVLTEPDGRRFIDAIADTSRRRMSVANWLEAWMVVDRRGDSVARTGFERLITEFGIELLPVSAEHARIARDAWRTFGKGVHKARLNFGDCFAYGTARAEREPLLFKGDDFPHTDIEPALKD